ncbi:uncharacterized protein CANTADRAFT_5104 [Suhomyces tanzawaensis NRRL Y-17324]|uniref:MINDY deubiquitinase domain-containing protein n=1 Tax=Suhomyces tanzawaensis NRRL Y-17324 TaxID=984487 RepID=A0A1E4SNQ3_9ASCO|nr:uncharacterized protein CANTADRAFT_5104 [Suhomyces tanzawaensis NRRL Y-17324]ODV81135.1 hypothetical protein CANTADRAFT_5104 [Suhomyces tanzawaensis NRRL Y-17324]
MASPQFPIRAIRWSLDYNSSNDDHKLITPILLQELNGPCPLIALVNTLLLKYELQYNNVLQTDDNLDPLHQKKFNSLNDLKNLLLTSGSAHGGIDLDALLGQIAEMLLVFNEDKSFDYEVDQLLESLPLLHTGLSVNPNLLNGNFARTDMASILFEIFDLKIKHGWVLNQIDSEQVEWNATGEDTAEDNYGKLIEILNQLQTFDKVQDYLLLELEQSGDVNEQLRSQDSKKTLLHNQTLINKWLDLNKTQLTKIGLKRLNLDLLNEEFVVFFRNNHFNTLFKKNNQEFYLLITDSAFENKASKIVWQSLNSVTGSDDLFFNGDFIPILDLDQDIDNNEADADFLLSKQLQEEEDQAMAKTIQDRYDKAETRAAAKAKPTKDSTFRGLKSKSKKSSDKSVEVGETKEEPKKKRDCIIV